MQTQISKKPGRNTDERNRTWNQKNSSIIVPLEIFPGLRVERQVYRAEMSESESPLTIVTCEYGPRTAIFSHFSGETRNSNFYVTCLNFLFFKIFKEIFHGPNVIYLWTGAAQDCEL